MKTNIVHIGQILFLLATLVACHSSHKPVSVICTNASFMLTDAQITDFTAKALQGNGEAAFKLSKYYDMLMLDRVNGLRWLTKAAENNHAVAQYNLGFRYDGKAYPALTDIKKAKFWYQRAADNGIAEAKLRLAELSQSQ